MRIVLDTNVALSALLWRGTSYGLFEVIRRQERSQLFSSPALLIEFAEVLARPWCANRLARIGRAAHEVLSDYIAAIELVTPSSVEPVVLTDPDDDHVIAAAIAADADLIVSGDHDLLAIRAHGKVRIVNPADAVRLLAVP